MTARLSGLAPWLAFAAILIAAPRIFPSATALTMMSLMGVMIIFALSYNMLLGQTGLLSFGHAVYYGLGGFVAIHTMNAVIYNKLGVSIPVIPLVGGLAGARIRRVVRTDSTRRVGLVLATIFDIGELVSSSSYILRYFFSAAKRGLRLTGRSSRRSLGTSSVRSSRSIISSRPGASFACSRCTR